MEQIEIEAMLEAVLFAHADPIGPEKLAAVLELPQSLVARGLERLQKRYRRPESGLELLCLEGHWQLATKNQYGPWVRKALETRKAVPLSNAAMETLTVIAYNQPGFLLQCVRSAGKGADRGGGPAGSAGASGELQDHRPLFAGVRAEQPGRPAAGPPGG